MHSPASLISQNELQPDILFENKGDHYLVQFLSQEAIEWAEACIDIASATWVDGKLVLEKKFFDHFEFAMIDEDFEVRELHE